MKSPHQYQFTVRVYCIAWKISMANFLSPKQLKFYNYYMVATYVNALKNVSVLKCTCLIQTALNENI